MYKYSLILALLFFSTNTFGCVCWFSTDRKVVKKRIKEADVVLYGTVVLDGLNDEGKSDSVKFISEIAFDVIQVWRGEKWTKMKFDQLDRPCGDAKYKIGERYIVFGYFNHETGKLETNNCACLNELTRPDPVDEFRVLNDGDRENYKKYLQRRSKEFLFVKNLISRKI